jgi:hypothetical protein
LIFAVTDVHSAKQDEIEAAPDVGLVVIDAKAKAYLSITARASLCATPPRSHKFGERPTRCLLKTECRPQRNPMRRNQGDDRSHRCLPALSEAVGDFRPASLRCSPMNAPVAASRRGNRNVASSGEDSTETEGF